MNNDFLDVITTRRSVRDYKAGDIPPQDVEKILQAGIMAPSPNNSQPWQFHVISGSTKDKFVDVLGEAKTLPKAWQPVIISGMSTVPLVIAVENPSFGKISNDTAPQEAAACTSGSSKDVTSLGSLLGTGACVENMLLAAHSLGHGSVWIGFPGVLEAARQVTGASGQIVAVLPIGHPADHQNEYFNRSRKPITQVSKFYN